MSLQVSAWVWRNTSSKIAGNHLVVLLALADVANDEGECIYLKGLQGGTLEGLATKCRVSRRTLIRIIQSLEDDGFLAVTRGKRHETNIYTVLMNQGCQSDTTEESRGVITDTEGCQTEHSVVPPVTPHSFINSINVVNVLLSEPKGSDSEEFSDEVIALTELLATLIESNGNRVQRPIGKRWFDACDKLLRIDKYTPGQVEYVIQWSQKNTFWQSNILSAPKLREKFGQLAAKIRSERIEGESKKSNVDKNLELVAALEQQQKGLTT